MALRSPVLLAVLLLLCAPLATAASNSPATATAASSSTCPASASASTCPASASTCPAHGQPPAAGMSGQPVSSSAEGTMEDEDERWERLLREANADPQAEGTLEEESEEERLLRQLERLMRVGKAAEDFVERLYHMANVLDFLGFHELAAGAPYLARQPLLASWQGSWTVFAVPDEVVQACLGCPAVGLLNDHMALGAFTYAQLSAKPMKKMAKSIVGFCFTASTSSSAGSASKATVFLDGVKISGPDLYNDGRLVVHGVEGLVVVPEEGSCFNTHRLSKAEILKIILRVFAFRPEEPLNL